MHPSVQNRSRCALPLFGAVAVSALMISAANASVIRVEAGDGAQERLQTALIDARPGDVVQLGPGRFDIGDSLSLDQPHIRVRGAGADRTILAFDKQSAGADGFLVTGDHDLVEDLAIENPKGNGIKAKGVDGIVFRKLRVEWTAGPKETNGAYGVYPVSSKHVLIDSVLVKGASDAGIYVGQSQEIIIKDSAAAYNVAGIEIENCYHADVHDNLATHNAGGILVFDLPGLPQMGGHSAMAASPSSWPPISRPLPTRPIIPCPATSRRTTIMWAGTALPRPLTAGRSWPRFWAARFLQPCGTA